MDSYVDTSDRRPVAYFLFALAFLGFMVFVGGVIVSSPPTAFVGMVILLLALVSDWLRRSAVT